MRLLALAILAVGGVASGLAAAGQPSGQSLSLANGPGRVTLGPATIGDLSPAYPGGTSDLRLTVSNPNPFPVRLDSARFGADGCTDPALRLARPLVLPARMERGRTMEFPAAVLMGLDATDDCQGQVLSVTLADPRLSR